MMRFGLIARAEPRGLGIQTYEIARHMNPAKILIVQMPDTQNRLVGTRFHWYTDLDADVMIIPVERMGDPKVVGPWLEGLDVVYSAETYYDWRFCDIARDKRVRTVLHMNPEFYRHHREPLPQPDVWWAPTTWMLDDYRLPRAEVVPMPVPIDRWPHPRVHEKGRPVTFVHIAGHPALADRNGTRLLFMALRDIGTPCNVRVRTQTRSFPTPGKVPKFIAYSANLGNIEDYWRLYDGADVLVMPRKYGGLCLPANEAAGAGLALIMADCAPNVETWPCFPVRIGRKDPIETPVGDIEMNTVDPSALASAMRIFASDHGLLKVAQQRSRAWAEAHSWELLAPKWTKALTVAAQR